MNKKIVKSNPINYKDEVVFLMEQNSSEYFKQSVYAYAKALHKKMEKPKKV